MKRIAMIAAASLLSAPANADILGSYYMSVHQQDVFNSSGARLTDLGAILQQDRANFHRFGRPGPSDESDRFFGDANLRAQIPALFAANPQNRTMFNQYTHQPGRENFADYIVFICGSGGRITSIALDYADGDGHIGCP